MNDADDHLRWMTPRRAPSELRSQVLAGVSRELQLRHSARNDRRLVFLTVAVVASVVAFVDWSSHDRSARLARALGPRPVSSSVTEIVRALEPAADSDRARQLTRRLMSAASRGSAGQSDVRRYRQLLDEINPRG
jgi:hypothetical protein